MAAIAVPMASVPEHIDVDAVPFEYVRAAPIISISNTVATYSLNTTCVPSQLAQTIPGISINRRLFAAGTGRTYDGVVLLFSSGRVVCAGANSIALARQTAIDVTHMLLAAGISVRYSDFNVYNIVCFSNTGFFVDLHRINQEYPTDSDYEPGRFPGLVFRFRTTPKITIIVFPAGPTIITGSRSKHTSEVYWAWFYNEILCRCRMDSREAVTAAHYHLERKRLMDTSVDDMWTIYFRHRQQVEQGTQSHVSRALVLDNLDALMDACAVDDDDVTEPRVVAPTLDPRIVDVEARLRQMEMANDSTLRDVLPGTGVFFQTIMHALTEPTLKDT